MINRNESMSRKNLNGTGTVFSIMVEARARRARASTIIDMVSHGFLGHFFCHHSNS